MPKRRGWAPCGTGARSSAATLESTPGFGFLDTRGNLTGFDIDLCRAVAAATLGDADAVELRIIDAAERGSIMQAGEVDMLVFVTTWTSSRDAAWGDFVPTMFYDGQGFMVPAQGLGVSTPTVWEEPRSARWPAPPALNMQDL